MEALSFKSGIKNLIILIFMLTSNVFAQSDFQIAGVVTNEDGPLYQAQMTLFEDNKVINEIKSGAYGEFSMKFIPNSRYMLMITKKDHLSKKIQIDTSVESELKRSKSMAFEIFLTYYPEESEGRDDMDTDFPFALISYDNKRHKLNYEELK